jgi:hypothetical protein
MLLRSAEYEIRRLKNTRASGSSSYWKLQHLTEYEHCSDCRAPQRASRSRSKAVDCETLLAGSRAFREHKNFPIPYVIFCEKLRISLRIDSYGGVWVARLGSTVTIFHPVVIHLRLTSSLVPAHPTTSTQRPRVSLPQLASWGECHDHRAGRWRRPR